MRAGHLFSSARIYISQLLAAAHPGVLFSMGHTANGKAAESYQKCCQGLARLGYVVLGFDPIGQGERINYPDSSGTRTELGAVTQEHFVPGKQLLSFWRFGFATLRLGCNPQPGLPGIASAGRSKARWRQLVSPVAERLRCYLLASIRG